LLTHDHFDHVLGLSGLFSRRSSRTNGPFFSYRYAGAW